MKTVREALIHCHNCSHGTGIDEICFHEEGCENAFDSEDELIPFKYFELKPELEAELKAADKALEKQTAKKAYEEMQDGIQLAIRCPICDHAVSYKQKCCHWCGQKLDWSE